MRLPQFHQTPLRAGRRSAGNGSRAVASLLVLGWTAVAQAEAGPGLAEHARRFFREDAPAYAAAPLGAEGRQWAAAAAVAAGIGAVMLADEGVRSTARDWRSSTTDDLADLVRGGGDPLHWGGALAVGTYLWGWAGGDATVREVGFQLLEAGVLTSAVTVALKLASGRRRPNRSDDSSDYRLLRGEVDGDRSSFPSQHTSFAFSLASVAAENVPGLGWVAYPLAAAVGLSRINDERHWASDVLAGAALGTATGWWVARRARARDDESQVRLLPWADETGSGLALTGRF